MRVVADVYAQAEVRMVFFKATRGTFNGLHSRSRVFASMKGPVVKRHRKVYLIGTTFEKVRYYDEQGRKVLKERYIGNKLTYLKLVEYRGVSNQASARWKFAEGDYLQHIAQPSSARRQSSYYFNPRPAAE
jgi:hypothetical protein